jgi:hypothetical protein
VEPRSRIFFLPFSFTRSDCSGQALSVRSFAALCPAALWFLGHNRHGGRDLALHHAYIDEEDRNQLGRSGLASQRLPGNVPPDVAEQGPAAAGTGHSKAGHRGYPDVPPKLNSPTMKALGHARPCTRTHCNRWLGPRQALLVSTNDIGSVKTAPVADLGQSILGEFISFSAAPVQARVFPGTHAPRSVECHS